ncbi:hypothetical protein CEXT_150771 [Caerostris extrusa]|uniref:Uncharacterized protein n=1 Tax=Caerostris extrusa TaxID=172846 RepID=A0AAV4P958_CAEEX|nr:hypothetical protein CEXT_150771 [Caerostris extrusa]
MLELKLGAESPIGSRSCTEKCNSLMISRVESVDAHFSTSSDAPQTHDQSQHHHYCQPSRGGANTTSLGTTNATGSLQMFI